MKMNRKRYFSIVCFTGILLTVLISVLFSLVFKKNERAEVQHTLEVYTARTEGLLNSLFHKTDILESIIITSKGEVPEETFNDLAKSLMQSRGIRAIQYLPDGVVKYCYPMEGNEKAAGENIFKNPKRKDDANLAKNTKQIALSGPYDLTQGGFGLVARNPIFLTDNDGRETFWGFSVIVLNLPDALDSLMLGELEHNGYEYSLYTVIDHKKVTIKASPDYQDTGKAVGEIKVPNHVWQLALSQKNHYSYYLNIFLILCFGLGITILCTIIVHMLEERNEQLKNYAEVDSLTGLVNRRKFLNYLELRCRDEKIAMALLYVDIDDFKMINDTYGHSQGDVLLKEVGSRLEQCIAGGDVAARMGGDEFVVLLEHLENREQCIEKIGVLTFLLQEPIKLESADIRITASIGYSLYPQEAAEPDALMELADHRMYQNKKKGRQKL